MRAGRMIVMVLATIAVVGLVAGCGPSADEQARTAFDEALHGVENATGTLYLLGPSSSTEQVKAGVERLTSAWEAAEKAGEGLEGIDLAEASAALDALGVAVGEVPDDAPSGAAFQAVMPLAQEFEAEVEKVHSAGGFHDQE